MVKKARIPPRELENWLQDAVKNPLEKQELPPGAMRGWGAYKDPDVAFRLEANGVPTYWPSQDPESGEKLSQEERKSWFLGWLGDELNPDATTLLNAGQRLRRQTLAMSLLQLHVDLQTSDPPTRDS